MQDLNSGPPDSRVSVCFSCLPDSNPGRTVIGAIKKKKSGKPLGKRMQDDFPIALHPPGLFLSTPGHHLKQLYSPPAPGDKQNGFWSRWKAWGQSWQEPSILQECHCGELNSSANQKVEKFQRPFTSIPRQASSRRSSFQSQNINKSCGSGSPYTREGKEGRRDLYDPSTPANFALKREGAYPLRSPPAVRDEAGRSREPWSVGVLSGGAGSGVGEEDEWAPQPSSRAAGTPAARSSFSVSERNRTLAEPSTGGRKNL